MGLKLDIYRKSTFKHMYLLLLISFKCFSYSYPWLKMLINKKDQIDYTQ